VTPLSDEWQTMRAAIVGFISTVVAGFVIWLKPRQETFFGLSVGMACGYYVHNHYVRFK
jgi:hypothetical protein